LNTRFKISVMIYENGHQISGPIVNQSRLFYALRDHGHDIQILCLFHDSSPIHDSCRENGFSTSRFPAGKYTHETLPWILEAIKVFEPDVFISDWIALGGFAARWIRSAGIPTIGGLRSDDGYFWAMMQTFARYDSGPWALSGVFCVSRELESKLTKNISLHTRTSFIPSGVPFPKVVPKKNPPIRMAYIGRIENRQKQILETASAMCMAALEIPGTTGVLIGNGPEEGSVRNLIKKKGCQNIIQMGGLVAPGDIQEQLSDANVIVLLSDYEGTPGALMDGMACGLVPVCMNSPGGIRGLVENNKTGLFVKDRGNSFLEAIRSLDGSPDTLQRLSRNAREHIRSDFTLEQTVTRWEQFCNSLLVDAGPRKPIKIPRHFHLPKQHPNMFGFDFRPPSKLDYLKGRCRVALGAIKRTLFCRN